MHWRGKPLLLALQTPMPAQAGSAKSSLCLSWAPWGSPSPVSAAQDRLTPDQHRFPQPQKRAG